MMSFNALKVFPEHQRQLKLEGQLTIFFKNIPKFWHKTSVKLVALRGKPQPNFFD